MLYLTPDNILARYIKKLKYFRLFFTAMSMEVMAAEFPDIYQQFMEPPPSHSAVDEDTGTSGIHWRACSQATCPHLTTWRP